MHIKNPSHITFISQEINPMLAPLGERSAQKPHSYNYKSENAFVALP